MRGPLSSPHHIGLDGSIAVLERLLERALHAARLWPVELPVAVGELLMAGELVERLLAGEPVP